MRIGLIIGIIVVVVLVVGGIYLAMNGSYKSTANPTLNPNQIVTPPEVSPGNLIAVSITNFAFSPATLTIKAGDTVIWTNNDNVPHTVTSDSGSELSSSTFNNGQTYSHTFNTTGTYSYHCSIHTGMKAKIIVQ